MPSLTPPTITTFLISLVIFFVGAIAHFVPQVAASVSLSTSWWLPVAAYLLLLAGVLIRGV